MSSPSKYYAFISYSRKDGKAAAWLQRRLEWFRFPVKLVPEYRRPSHSRYVRPIYRDKTNLEVTDGHYWTNIRRALEESRYLIVLCSSHAATSEPVNMEVAHFLETHGGDTSLVAPVILSGSVTSADADAALCPALRALGDTLIRRNLPTMVPDAVTAEQDSWEQGFISLVSYLLCLERTVLGDHIQRETKRQARVLRRWLEAVGLLTFIAAVSAWLAFAAQKKAKAEQHRAEDALGKVAASEKVAEAERDKAIESRKSADELIYYMQYDLRSTLENVGRLSLMQGVDDRIARYRKEHPPEAGDRVAERERAVMIQRQGDVFFAQGKLAEALAAYREMLAICERLAEAKPDYAGWQRDLSVSYGKIGDVLSALGQITGALESYRKSLAIIERLAKQDTSSEWQYYLAVSYDNVGQALGAQAKLDAALESYRKSLAIIERLAKADPDNADRRRELSASYDRVGGALNAQGQFEAALESFRQSMAIRERLVKADPDNTSWQHDLVLSYNWIGVVLHAQGELAGALESFRQSVIIAEQLTKTDPDNAIWQRDLASNYERFGGIAQQQKRWADAADALAREVALARPWLDKKDADVQWLACFANASGRCWRVLRDAPAGTVKLDRAQLLADLRNACDRMRELKEQGRLVPPMDKSLSLIERHLAEAEAGTK